jgi:hypothetical protein
MSLIKPVKDTNRKFFLSIRPHGRRIEKAIVHGGKEVYAVRPVAAQPAECRELRGGISLRVVANGMGDATE